jgi:hypothetical protein
MRLDVVIKIGGSLDKISYLNKLSLILRKITKNYHCVIIPGGGKFADTIRNFDKRFHFSNKLSHRMAILAMSQYGLYLSGLMKIPVTEEIKDFKKEKLIIFLPAKYMLEKDPLENSWDVTSDSIAAHIAQKLGVKKLVLVKDVDGIFSSDPKKNPKSRLIKRISSKELIASNKKTCIDRYLPKILLKNKFKCYIVNGKYPKRIESILEGKEAAYTEIV